MHRCLRIAEITELICDQGFHDVDAECRNGIIALAQTCRWMYEPAVKVIWRQIPTLLPLLATVPDEIWNGVKISRLDVDNTRPLRPSDLIRFKELGKRVRRLGLDHEKLEGHEDFPAETATVKRPQAYQYEALCLAAGHTTLLPNLLKITLIDPDPAILGHINLFTNPCIKTFRMGLSAKNCPKQYLFHVSGFLNSLRDRYPLLETLDLQLAGFILGDSFIAATERTIRSSKWENLSKIVFRGDASATTVLDIFQRPSLKVIDIHTPIVTAGPPPTELGGICNLMLPLLEQLTLFVGNMSVILDFLRLLSPGRRSIRAVHLWAASPGRSSLERWVELLECLHTGCQAETLEVLDIDDRVADDEDNDFVSGPQYTLSFDHLKRLFSFKSLTVISILTYGIFILDDAVLAQVVQCWPKAQELRLEGQHRRNYPPKVTAMGLSLLADHCPDLKILSLAFNSDTALVSKPGSKPRFGRALEELDVVRSPITRPSVVAAFLADIFPCIKAIVRNDELEEEVDDLWQQVQEQLPVFAKVRSDEAARRERDLVSVH